MCRLCVVEDKDGKDLRKKRRELEGEAVALIERFKGKRVGRVEVLKAKKLEKGINDTYDDERWKGLPRKDLEGMQKWLAEVKTC